MNKRLLMNNLELNIINKAINQFEQETRLRFTANVKGNNIDFILRNEEYDLQFAGEVKQIITKTNIGMIKNQLDKLESIPLLITTYVNDETAEVLKNLKINYLDTVGNAYLNVPPLLINIKGQKISTPKNPVNKGAGIFKTAGLQIIFSFLCNAKLENNSLREIAEMSNVALGTVHVILKQLEKHGFLVVDDKQKKKIVNKEILLKEWVAGYQEKIKPKYFVGKY